MHSPLVEHYKVKALYLEPGGIVSDGGEKEKHGGVMAVDGEEIPYGPIGLEIFRGLVNLLCQE